MSVAPSEQSQIIKRSSSSIFFSVGDRRKSLNIADDVQYQLSPIWLEFKEHEIEKQYVREELVIAARQQRMKSKFFYVISIVNASCIISLTVAGVAFPFLTPVTTSMAIWFTVEELTIVLPTFLFDSKLSGTMENATEALVDARVVWAIALVAFWFVLLATSMVDASLHVADQFNYSLHNNSVFDSVELLHDAEGAPLIFVCLVVPYFYTLGLKAIFSTGFRFRMKQNYVAFLVTSTSVSVWLFVKGNVCLQGEGGQLWIIYLIAYGFCVFMDLVASLVPTYIYELSQRRNFVLQQLLKQKIQSKTEINRALANENVEMQNQLAAARKLVASVMAEGKAVLRTYEIKFESIEFHEPREKLGEGSFGTVYLGTLRGQHKVAVKTMRVSKINKAELTKFKSELIIMCPLHHPNLVKLYGGVWNEGADKLCIVLEFCPHGSLATYLKAVRGSWESMHYGLALGAAKGLAHLHSDMKEPLMHRDIKPDNILVGDDVVAKLADFGESRNFDQGAAKTQAETGDGESDALSMTMVGTELFCAPEVMLGQRYNESADTYSYALVLLCLVSSNITYVKEQYQILRMHSLNIMHLRPPIPPSVLEKRSEIARLIQQMWQGDFRLRPTMRNVANNLINLKPVHYILRTKSPVNANVIESKDVILKARGRHMRSSKLVAAFLTHHKDACVTEARLVKREYEALLGVECFFDSENLRDLRKLMDHVKDSDTLIIFLSKEVLRHPRCLIELHTAIEHDIPIVALNCQGKGYDFVEASDFMLHLDTSLATLNPGAVDILKVNGVDPVRLAHKLWSVVPNIIAIPFNTTASENAIKTMMVDIVRAVTNAKPVPIKKSFEQWYESRAKEKEMFELEESLDNKNTKAGNVDFGEAESDGKIEDAVRALLENQKLRAQIESMRTASENQAKAYAIQRQNLEIALAAAEAELQITKQNDDDTGILSGMFAYHPDKQSSIVGKGEFGTVYRMINPHDRQISAVKELKNLTREDGSTDDDAMGELLDEVRKMGIVQSEYIVQYYTSAIYHGRFYEGVDYRDTVIARQASGVPFTDEQIVAWVKQIALGLKHLHEVCKLVHQDLHNGNVMITNVKSATNGGFEVSDESLSATSVKILDLGLASFKSDHTHRTTTRTMLLDTVRTMRIEATRTRRASFVELPIEGVGGFKAIRAPEMHLAPLGSKRLRGKPFGESFRASSSSSQSAWLSYTPNGMLRFDAKVDMWALGILMTEAVLLTPIEEWYTERAIMQVFGRTPRLQSEKIEEVAARSAVLGSFVKQLLTKNPRQRISAAQVVEELDSGGLHRRSTVVTFDPLLESLSGVSKHEMMHVAQLRNDLEGDDVDLNELPEPIGGSIGLLRAVRYSSSPIVLYRKILEMREKFGCDAIYREIIEQGSALHTLPGAAEAHAASWQTNDWLTTDKEGDVVVYERWGAVNPKRLHAVFSLEKFRQWQFYRREAWSIILDVLSRRGGKVVQISFVLDVAGATLSHRKMLPFIKAFANRDDKKTIMPSVASIYLTSVNSVVTTLSNRFLGTIVGERHRKIITLLSGDPFATSVAFAARFDRSVMPADVGGSLTTGADGHCCLGVEQPALCDEEAVWAAYTRCLRALVISQT